VAYKIEAKRLKLILDDYEGAEVVCRLNISLGQMLELQEMGSDSSGIRAAYQRFGDDVLIEWSISDDQGPIPASGDGMLRLTSSLASTIMGAWGEQVASVPQSAVSA
jgi:hypothetical protein